MIVGFFTARRASTARHQHIEHNSEPFILSEPQVQSKMEQKQTPTKCDVFLLQEF